MKMDQRYWNATALVVFIVLCALSTVLISRYGSDVTDLEFFDLAVLGLGTLRLIHLLTYDKIFEFVRAYVIEGQRARQKKALSGWRQFVYEFLECIWCTGMWSGVFAVTIYLLGSWGRIAVIVLAVAGLGSLLQVISKAIADSAR